MEFNSEAVTAAGFGVDVVAFERLKHTNRTKVSTILRRDKGIVAGEAEPSGPTAALVAGARRTAYSLIVWPPSSGVTVCGVLETAAPPLGFIVEDEDGF